MMTSRSGASSSLLSDDEVLHARETYRPSAVVPTGEMAFNHWTERVWANGDTVVARELAGLTNDQLANLASEFEKAPRRRRTDFWRFCMPAGIGLFGASALSALVEAILPGQAVGATPFVAAALASGALSAIAVTAGALHNFRQAPVEMAYAKLGLLVGMLNEQHPWLYKAFLLQRHPAAAAYSTKVLAERGVLRGVDYVLMREVAERHDGLELTRTAREVAMAIQAAPTGGAQRVGLGVDPVRDE